MVVNFVRTPQRAVPVERDWPPGERGGGGVEIVFFFIFIIFWPFVRWLHNLIGSKEFFFSFCLVLLSASFAVSAGVLCV
ncbi:hypothetical protein P167DRAFT_229903 [Morchella conica CCBAS932]|uniref:Transmembrane protein n=1 Tax=Morchella conica CCBAS932 TaxID=1392247 RepID=A0A3N4KZU9_9PEZI|nr:hypothetical protein P167DRAFT_229903 [Morchella conica CCBAS932]